ncbi:MAG: ChaN family lipoprotein [Cyanobacteria bacterium P01_E01_bin.6]
MTSKALIRLVGVLLMTLLPYGCSTVGKMASLPSVVAQRSDTVDVSDRIQPFAQVDVVYLGETHDSTADHDAQLQIVQALYAQNPEMAIALEMFQHPFQESLDNYISGTIDEETLREQTQYDLRWGFPWEYYAPILRFAREHQIPLLALNAPSEVVSKIAREGLDSLSESEQQVIPPRSEIRTDNEGYREYVGAVFGHAHHSGHSGMSFENFFSAQVVWDETMAEQITAFLTREPGHQVVVLAGQGHVIYGYGIPDRVARRLGDSIEQYTILLNPIGEFLDEGEGAIADSFWFSENGQKP